MIKEIVSEEQRKLLRKIKTPPMDTKNLVYAGCLAGPMMASQFNEDCRIYGLWEALLYVEGYEANGYYKEGTAKGAVCHLLNGTSVI